jgi:hypothetical protein
MRNNWIGTRALDLERWHYSCFDLRMLCNRSRNSEDRILISCGCRARLRAEGALSINYANHVDPFSLAVLVSNLASLTNAT